MAEAAEREEHLGLLQRHWPEFLREGVHENNTLQPLSRLGVDGFVIDHDRRRLPTIETLIELLLLLFVGEIQSFVCGDNQPTVHRSKHTTHESDDCHS